ncbi:MAG: MarR family winged helix-turn-helix transcriptional regulator [Anaerolineales bacterium]|nr:MarR family winged helix-turn-helix transcriptional regulator [Anaerolineales bacterium]
MTDSDAFDAAMRDWIRVFTRRSMQSFARWMNESGLSNSQISALMRLYYHGNCRISGMADDLGVTNAAASQMVERLVSMQLLERAEDPHDRRVKQISLSPYGLALLKEGLDARLDWMKDLNDRLLPEQRESVTASLRALIEVAQETEQEPELISEKL